MKYGWWIAGLLLLVLLLSVGQAWASWTNIQAAGLPASAAFQPIALTGQEWQAKAGFDPRFTAGFLPGEPGVIALPAPAMPISLNAVFRTTPGSGLHEYTLSTTFDLPTVPPERLALMLPELGENWAVYLNGRLLRSEIYLDAAGTHMLIRRSMQDVVIALPAADLRVGTNILVFRMLGDAYQVALFPGWAPGFPLSEGYRVALEADLYHQQTQRSAVALFQVGAYVFFGLYMLFFYINRYQELSHLFLVVFMLGFGTGWQLMNSPFIFSWYPDTSLITRLSYTATVCSGTLAPTIWFYLFPMRRTPWFIRAVIIYLAAVIVCLLVVPFGWIELFLRSYLLFLLLLVLTVLWTLWRAWQARSPDVGKVTILLVISFGLVSWDLIDVVYLHTGWITSPYMPFLFSGLFSVVMINRYWRLSVERERMRQDLILGNQELLKAHDVLESQVQQRTIELRQEVFRREQAQQLAENRAIEADTLREAGAAMVETLDRQQMVERILEQLRRVVPCDSASVQLLMPDGIHYLVIGAIGFADKGRVIGTQRGLNEADPAAPVYRTRQPRLVANILEEKIVIDHPDNQVLSWLCVPLIYAGEVIGVLTLDSVEANHFSPRHADLVLAFAGPVALALHNAHVYEQARRGAEELAMFYEIGLTITAGLDMNGLLAKLYSAACRLAPVDSFFVAFFDADTCQVSFPLLIDHGESRDTPPFSITEFPNSLTAWVVKNKKTLYVTDLFHLPEHLKLVFVQDEGDPICSFMGVPLIARDQLVGVMSLQSNAVNAYSNDHIRLFETLAAQAEVAIENSRLFSRVERELSLRQQAEKQILQANLRLQEQINEIQKLQADLREQAIRDSLTGLFNRRYMEETFVQELARAHREKTSIGVILLDIDNFKIVNDTFGHEAGDSVLVALGKVLSGRLRASDNACRYGGEEFLLLLPGSNRASTLRRAEELRQTVEDMAVAYGGALLKITISLGVSVFPEDGREIDALIRHADNLLYLAKNSGRNRISG
jgi:diguanylate cyclase (GGDEF)-like protein